MKSAFLAMQKLGRSLMLPIAVLPVAGLLLRLGQPDLLDLPYVAAAGNAVFANLGLLFAIGIAVGLAKENNGAAGLAAVVAYLVATEGAKVLIDVPAEVVTDAAGRMAELLAGEYRSSAIAKMSVPAGLICGVLAGNLYNRFSEVRFPDYLAFFAGRRFVPIVSGFAALLVAALFGFGWPVLEAGMNSLSEAVVGSGEVGLFGYGLLNRLLIITGLHHILNNLAWFLIGDFEGVTGDLRRFFAGDPSAGAFMSGFFPVMMFGLPAACLAMYRAAEPARRKAVGGLLLSMGLTSFLTGITEPIEFTFMFVAPLLYAIHAVLTGLSMVVMDALQIRLGFGFSAGLFDYVLNFNRATYPWLLLPIGLTYFFVYYATFRFAIAKFNLKTPGRDAVDREKIAVADAESDEIVQYLAALGGAANLLTIDACTTRLRLKISSIERVDKDKLRGLGAAGLIQPTNDSLQVVVGLRADEIATRLARLVETKVETRSDSVLTDVDHDRQSDPGPEFDNFGGLLEALGGASNVAQVEALSTRMRVQLNDVSLASEQALLEIGFRGLALAERGVVHVLSHDRTESVSRKLKSLIDSR